MASQSVTSALYGALCRDLSRVFGSGIDSSFLEKTQGDFDIPPDATISQFRARALCKSLLKKFVADNSTDADNTALLKFLSANTKCGDWCLPEPDGSLETQHELELMGEFRKELHSFFLAHRSFTSFPFETDEEEVLSLDKVVFLSKTGPGVVVDGAGTSWIEKFGGGPLTYSREFLWNLYQTTVKNMPLLAEVEEIRNQKWGHRQVQASKLVFVPKTFSESRCICVEPALNMYFQQGVMTLLQNQLKAVLGIDLASQQGLNRRLAREGSINGSYATIDLSSASDTISCKMLRWALPSHIYNFLSIFRTPFVSIEGLGERKLEMFSSMGNAFTFPLQTIIFASAVRAAYTLCNVRVQRINASTTVYDGGLRRVRYSGNYAVNGDDIIVLQRTYSTVCRLLHLLGFQVNAQKSFSEGFFRESCGFDAYKGQAVRGVYCKALRTKQDYISLFNRLVEWSVSYHIPLNEVLGFLARKVGRINFVPLYEDDTAGIKIPSVAFSRSKILGKNLEQLKYHYHKWEFNPTKWSYDECQDLFGPAATLVAAVRGEMKGGNIVIREDRGVYHLRRCTSSTWDWHRVESVPPWHVLTHMTSVVLEATRRCKS